ncbi:MAG: ABC transporter ATP-binding protein, partial [Eggerthellaceae bacterium]|nr:ABC transporter ATP-binding protein [Eggerthellaceae bacterium]
GGFVITMAMDLALAMILLVMTPVLLAVVLFISVRGVPLYEKVQHHLDDVVRIMRESITGIRVVKALSREDYARTKYADANDALTKSDIHANAVMAIPGPFMQLCLNTGLTLVILVGAQRVNSGLMKPGVILAFLTYFNMILQSIMGLNRLFVMYSKAKASADRMDEVLKDLPDQRVFSPSETAPCPEDAYLVFDHVRFSYGEASDAVDETDFAGAGREQVLKDISFSLQKGESLGIIGATGSGKSTIIHLLMRFSACTDGAVYLDGRDVRTYDFDDLRRHFGVVLQNDTIFANSIAENISFGRDLYLDAIEKAASDASADFIDDYPDGFSHRADIRGANFSGGQKQRILIARALADRPDILILDDSSSALDYRTDAQLRRTLRQEYGGTTTIMIAQRISSIRSCTKILVLEDGATLALGTHEELLERCPLYREIYESQMGELA